MIRPSAGLQVPDELGRARTSPEVPRSARKRPDDPGREGVYERPKAVLTAFYMLTGAGFLERGASAGDDHLEQVPGSKGS